MQAFAQFLRNFHACEFVYQMEGACFFIPFDTSGNNLIGVEGEKFEAGAMLGADGRPDPLRPVPEFELQVEVEVPAERKNQLG